MVLKRPHTLLEVPPLPHFPFLNSPQRLIPNPKSYIDLCICSVSTGLGLSLDNCRLASSGESSCNEPKSGFWLKQHLYNIK
ncbi:hypothetical protein L1987_78253 [Smallanthus sonchifolius]|uniref:Uncharacterized protein n=1 Tax=Smallanthus sonchifolius TaxID=185202 RepID=A0ACB8ZD64_9ASTR|nr:hypothetical protein L1987_78253 [Smallanthus sonchifolius]